MAVDPVFIGLRSKHEERKKNGSKIGSYENLVV